MKKRIFTLALLPLLALFGCKQEEIVFDHEKPAFDTKEGMILLEVIAPRETLADDAIYISGAFNGSDDEAAAANPAWQLEKSTVVSGKWGIYLDPETFVDGKTLADGYRFISVLSGEERTALNQAVSRDIAPQPGTRTNVYVTHWASFFESPAEEDPDQFYIYVDNRTGWDELALYAWGNDLPELFGGWPGIAVEDDTIVKDGIVYKVYTIDKESNGLTYNLIFNNNNNGSQLGDFQVVLNRNYYLQITEEGCTEVTPIDHDGYAIYVIDETGWDALALYAWGNDLPELFGGWPGAVADGTVTNANGAVYSYFDVGKDNEGLTYNLIFNNNNQGSQLGDFPATLNRDYYLHITSDGCEEIDPLTAGE